MTGMVLHVMLPLYAVGVAYNACYSSYSKFIETDVCVLFYTEVMSQAPIPIPTFTRQPASYGYI